MRGQSGIKGRDGVPIVRSGIMLLNALYQFDNYDSWKQPTQSRVIQTTSQRTCQICWHLRQKLVICKKFRLVHQ